LNGEVKTCLRRYSSLVISASAVTTLRTPE
jgi:hypothetical protein